MAQPEQQTSWLVRLREFANRRRTQQLQRKKRTPWILRHCLESWSNVLTTAFILLGIFSEIIFWGKSINVNFPSQRSFSFIVLFDTYLVHIATEMLILFLQSLYKALWSNHTCFLLLRTYLQKGTMNCWPHYHD